MVHDGNQSRFKFCYSEYIMYTKLQVIILKQLLILFDQLYITHIQYMTQLMKCYFISDACHLFLRVDMMDGWMDGWRRGWLLYEVHHVDVIAVKCCVYVHYLLLMLVFRAKTYSQNMGVSFFNPTVRKNYSIERLFLTFDLKLFIL